MWSHTYQKRGSSVAPTSSSRTSRTAVVRVLVVLCLSSGFALSCQQVTVVKLLAVAQHPFRRGMNVLMAQKMNQNKITVDILPPFSASMEMVDLEFFIIEEGFSSLCTPTMLPFCELLFGDSQAFGFHFLSR